MGATEWQPSQVNMHLWQQQKQQQQQQPAVAAVATGKTKTNNLMPFLFAVQTIEPLLRGGAKKVQQLHKNWKRNELKQKPKSQSKPRQTERYRGRASARETERERERVNVRETEWGSVGRMCSAESTRQLQVATTKTAATTNTTG